MGEAQEGERGAEVVDGLAEGGEDLACLVGEGGVVAFDGGALDLLVLELIWNGIRIRVRVWG